LNISGRLPTPIVGSGNAQIAVGGKTITVAAAALEHAAASHKHAASASPARAARPRPRQAAPEALTPDLSPLGRTMDEVLPADAKYLDRAVAEGLARVDIVHGVGSGRLRQAIAELLEHHPLVRRFQAGDAGGGTTIVELEG